MASSSSSTPSPQPRNKYDGFLSFRGEDTSICWNDQLSAHTSIFGLPLLVVLGICIGAAIVIVLFLISLWFTKRKEIQQIKIDPSLNMSSSSSSPTSSQSRKKYDVFISFRGEDTRVNFTSHLHEALRSRQIDTYIDYRLEKGDDVWQSLEKAIKDSILFLVIFSENYASSSWCLKELAKILECSKNEGHLLMPVFYRVDPSHIRKQSGSYQKAFKRLKHKGIDKQQLQNWREALTHATNLSGWHCGVDRSEAEVIKEITECVVKKLDDKCPSEDYLKDLIGIHRKMADVKSLLYKGSNDDVRFIGIWGMGGMGKTTLAKALFDKFHSAYEGSCFLSRVREKSKKYGIAALKKKLISELLGDKESHVNMVDDTIPDNAIRRLRRRKVFIVLDDVDDHDDQLENLAGSHRWFGPGSKILVTARDREALKKLDDIYKVEALKSDEAFQLFSLNAFEKDYGGDPRMSELAKEMSGDPKMSELAKEMTRYACGNPSALKALGKFFNGKSEEVWKSHLRMFEKLPFQRITDIMKLSFKGLDIEEKNIFLDNACFFNGCYARDMDIVTLLNACGYETRIGLDRLKDKALLDISGDVEEISMHNLIKEMGQQIAYENDLRSRLCDFHEICKILKENKGGDAIQGIILEASELLEEIRLSLLAFRSMPNLKFIIFDKGFEENKNFPRGIEFLPNELKLFCWKEYPSKSLPATFKAESLVLIKMHNSNLTKLWDGDQNLQNLREIDLYGSKDLIELPNFSKALHLEGVDLRLCSKLHSVHPSILSLPRLAGLWLSGCKALTSLTCNAHMKSLKQLNLQDCSRLNRFSVTSENCLELNLSGTAINDELCSSNGRLCKIHSLVLFECQKVTSLNNWVDLRSLRSLEASCCNKLALNLCSLFNEIRSLEVLCLMDCNELFEVPENISLLSSLASLYLSGTNIKTLPSSIKYLSSLKELVLDGCKRLCFLPELPPSIRLLSAEDCLSLETLHFSHIHNDDMRKVIFLFTNCMKLDIKAVETKVLLDINKAIYKDIRMEYPGKRVPEWFMYRTTQCLVDVDLCSIPEPWDGYFIFCVVISTSALDDERLDDEWLDDESLDDESLDDGGLACVDANWFIDGQNACRAGSCCYISDSMLSDHIIVWYNRDSYKEVQRKIEEKKRDAESNTYHPLLQIQFTADYPEEIKEYGVCLTSVLECQNHIRHLHSVGSSGTKFNWTLRNIWSLRLRKPLKKLANIRSSPSTHVIEEAE